MDGTEKNSILIVDDEKSNLKLLNHILGADYTIYTAKDGQTAIEIAEECVPDLILLDIIMPGMDGYETLSILKSSEKLNKIPVIFITGLSSSEDEEKGLELQAADYISKPFSMAIVKLRVRNQMQIVNQIRVIELLSVTDPLTGIPNRHGFDSRLEMEWGRAIREHLPISLLIIDVDKFKGYNDTYGHQLGDLMLQTVAKIFSHSLRRPYDLASRWGGDEFAILLPNTDLNGALDVAEVIRAGVESSAIPCPDGTSAKITVSIGVNTQLPMQGDSVDDFISKADKSLYSAKSTGRNMVGRHNGA